MTMNGNDDNASNDDDSDVDVADSAAYACFLYLHFDRGLLIKLPTGGFETLAASTNRWSVYIMFYFWTHSWQVLIYQWS